MSYVNSDTVNKIEKTSWKDNRNVDTNKVSTQNDILSIAGFLGSVILISWIGGLKATYWYLLVVLAGVTYTNVGRYSVNITTPEIMKGD